jgi:hypothetical protein
MSGEFQDSNSAVVKVAYVALVAVRLNRDVVGRVPVGMVVIARLILRSITEAVLLPLLTT